MHYYVYLWSGSSPCNAWALLWAHTRPTFGTQGLRFRWNTIKAIVESAVLLWTVAKSLLADAFMYSSSRSAYSHHSNLTAATHSWPAYSLKLARAAEGDIECTLALVHKQQSIMITPQIPPPVDEGAVIVEVCVSVCVCAHECLLKMKLSTGWGEVRGGDNAR